jgi:hypothetical protein
MKIIRLSRGQTAIVDDIDYTDLSQFKWYLDSQGLYVVHGIPYNGKQTKESMHRRILGAQPGQDVDHINHNGLDNRRENLRLCTRSQNNANMKKHGSTSSKFKGVVWRKARTKWIAQIIHREDHKRRHTYLGSFKNEEDAARAYDRAAKELFGEFALLNFPIK